jgi:uncharacterized membrane protein YbhN (UPF0104 family)
MRRCLGACEDEDGMLESVRGAIAFLREKQVLHKLGILVSLVIIAVSFKILYHMLDRLDVEAVGKAIVATQWYRVALAALCVAAGYITLTVYDLFALRTIGHGSVPYRIAAFAGFTSYSIGHNVGASVFSGGAVRYRIYSAWGLGAVDVAKICFVAGLTFWLGNAAVLGLGVAYHPEAATSIDRLPVWFNRLAAFGILAGLAAYVIWVWLKPRVVGHGSWTVTLPGGLLTLLQIAIGIIDLGFCALAMYLLVPNDPHVGFVVVAVIFVSATLLGFASHSPGGLGVFDAAMLVGLLQFDKAQLVACLMLFRVLYYYIPFLISVVLLTAREIMMGMRAKRISEALHRLDESPNPKTT